MSFRTLIDAVAVRERTGIPTACFWIVFPSVKYEVLKSCPHSEMQWTSSTTIEVSKFDELMLSMSCRNSFFCICSGERNRNLSRPCLNLEKTLSLSAPLTSWDIYSARPSKPNSLSSATWSLTRAVIGQTTREHPRRMRDDSWKHMDLPPPVGKSPSVEGYVKCFSIMFSCPSLKFYAQTLELVAV